MINLDVAPFGDGDVAPFGDGERHAALDPARPDHLHGLARSLARAGESDAAAEACAWAVALRPDSVVNRQEAGRLMTLLGRTAEAMTHYREALSLRASDPSSMLPLAVLIIDGDGDLSLAIDLLRQCLRASPEDPTPHFHLGRAWTLLGETRDAVAGFERYLEMEAEDPLGAGAALAVLRSHVPDRCTGPFVRLVFDQYADHFDETLVIRLRYRGPQIVAEAVRRSLGGDTAPRDILDLGCGTGLAGVELKPLARRLAGVDLSPKMIEKARERRIYDLLSVGDIVLYLGAAREEWDVVAAADVLVYLGDLGPLFAAAARALRENGLFAATVEEADAPGYEQSLTKRFRHHADYIRAAAARAGLETASVERVVPRHEKNEPVRGLVFVLRKPAGGAP